MALSTKRRCPAVLVVPAAALATQARNAHAAGQTRLNVSCENGMKEAAPVRQDLSCFLVCVAAGAAPSAVALSVFELCVFVAAIKSWPSGT